MKIDHQIFRGFPRSQHQSGMLIITLANKWCCRDPHNCQNTSHRTRLSCKRWYGLLYLTLSIIFPPHKLWAMTTLAPVASAATKIADEQSLMDGIHRSHQPPLLPFPQSCLTTILSYSYCRTVGNTLPTIRSASA